MGVLATASLLALGVLSVNCFKIEYVQVPEYQGEGESQTNSLTFRPIIKSQSLSEIDPGHSANIADTQPQPLRLHDRIDIPPQKVDMAYLSKPFDDILSNYNAKIAGATDGFYDPEAFQPIYEVQHIHDLNEDYGPSQSHDDLFHKSKVNKNIREYSNAGDTKLHMETRSYDEEEPSYESPVLKKSGEVHYHEHEHYHNHEHKQDHKHEHRQEHKHAHNEDHKHKHQHAQTHAHEQKSDHSHSHEHKQNHNHKHDQYHNHGHKHMQQHNHKHLEEHKQGHNHHHEQHHNHDHGHQHSHHQEHKHDHGHDHKHNHHHGHNHDGHHDHRHKEQHGHMHHEQHGHKHGHKHDHKQDHEHDHKYSYYKH